MVAVTFQKAYHAQNKYTSFTEFLEMPWKSVKRESENAGFYNPVDLWNRKNLSYLELAKYTNCITLRYEELLEDP